MNDAVILGSNKRCYPSSECEDLGSYVEINVVLVAGDPAIGDYAAYAGQGSDQWVAARGAKLCFEEAQVHFCNGLEKSKYRE